MQGRIGKGLCLVGIFLLLWSGTGTVQAERTVLRVGCTECPGFFMRDEAGRYGGYAYMYMESLAPYGNWRMEYIPGSREENLERLSRGEVDVVPGVMSGVLYPGLRLSAIPFMHAPVALHLRDGVAALAQGGQLRIASNARVDGNLLAGMSRSDALEGLTCQAVSYATDAAVCSAYQNGEVDGVLGGIMGYPDFAKPVAMLENKPVYLAVSAGKPELKHALDDAMQQISIINPRLQTELFEDNYTNHLEGPLLLTPEEREYLQQKKTLVVLSSPGQKPYSYFEDGEHKGVIAEIMKLVAADLGVTFEVRETASNAEVMQQLQDGSVDIITDFYYDYNWGRANHVDVTFPYLDLKYVAILRRNDALPERPRVACIRGHYYTHSFVEKQYEADQLLYFDTLQQCLQAVSAGAADITFTKAITAQEDILKGNYYDLVTNGNVVFSHKVAMGVNDRLDPVLYRILNKEIAHLNSVRIQGIVNKEVFDIREERNVISMLYRYPLGFLSAVLLLASLIIGTLLYALWIRRRHLRQLRQMAYTDVATGLPNLRWLQNQMPRMLAELQAERQEGRVLFLLIGVSRLNLLWEIYGREPVGRVLCEQVRRVVAANSWIKTAAVLPGTGRCYVLVCLPPGRSAEDFLPLFLEKYEVLQLGDLSIRLHLQSGMYRLSYPAKDSFMHMLNAVDIAYNEMQGTEKILGSYNAQLQQELKTKKRIEDSMEQALQDHEFEVWCQPKYDIRTHALCGAEALVRWESSQLGRLMPGQFIRVFEHNGFILRFDYYMLEQVCQLQRQRLSAGLPIVPISVNQSRLHMKEEGYVEKMRHIADGYALPSGCIELELTETTFADFDKKERRQHALQVIQELRAMGFSISMDDFGSGYSSMSLLQVLPMDVMKIDRSMLLAAEASERARVILDHTIQLGRSLEMQVICEGIETPEQEAMLLEAGCCYGQGYLYARPMALADFVQFMQDHPV